MNAKKAKKDATEKSPREATQDEPMVTYAVKFSEEADQDLDAISDQKTVRAIIKRAVDLRTDPLVKGKPLQDELMGYRSQRAAGQRYRIIYRVFEEDGEVVVVVVGIRQEGSKKDVYQVAERRLT